MECGESAGNFGENGTLSPGAVHFPLRRFIFPGGTESSGGVQQGVLGEVLSIQVL